MSDFVTTPAGRANISATVRTSETGARIMAEAEQKLRGDLPRAPMETGDLLAFVLSLFALSPAAVVCGYVSQRQAAQRGLRQHPIGAVGLALGVVGTVIWMLILALAYRGDVTPVGPDYSSVQKVYDQMGYAPPDYTDITYQSKGVCSNLATGQSVDQAANNFTTWGVSLAQAQVIVTTVRDSGVCQS